MLYLPGYCLYISAGAFWRWCLSTGEGIHCWDFVFHHGLVGKGSGHTRVCGALPVTVSKSNCRDRRFSNWLTHGMCLGSLRKHCLVPTPEIDVMGLRGRLAWEAGKASQGILTRSGLSTAHRQPLPPAVGLRTPPVGPAEVEEASREQEEGSLY